MWFHVFYCFKAYLISCISHSTQNIYNSRLESGSFQISSVNLAYMFSAWSNYRCARTSSIMSLIWHPLQFNDYVDIQVQGLQAMGELWFVKFFFSEDTVEGTFCPLVFSFYLLAALPSSDAVGIWDIV